MEFTSHENGKNQKYTYDTVKEHILEELQKDLRNGSDISVNLRKETDIGIPILKPRRKRARRPKKIVKAKNKKEAREDDSSETFDDPVGELREDASEEFDDLALEEELRLEQQDYDMEYTLDLKEWKARTNTYEDNKFKAYAVIFGYCNKIMQNRIEETIDFEANIRNNPFVLLATIKLKMYGQSRGRYEFVQPTDTITQFLLLKQDHGESLVEYYRRFKQSVDNLREIFGDKFLNEFTEKMSSYKISKSIEEKNGLKKKAFSSWISYVYLMNSDNNKYGSLKRTLRTQYALQNNQYPTTMGRTNDALTNHRWDVEFKNKCEVISKGEPVGTSLVQSNKNLKYTVCYCCGQLGHYATKCPKRDKIDRKDWAIKPPPGEYESKEIESKDETEKPEDECEDKKKKKVNWSGTQIGQGIRQGINGCQVHRKISLHQIHKKKANLDEDTSVTFNPVKGKHLFAGVTAEEMNDSRKSEDIEDDEKVPRTKT
jgi:hypothetical protein